jgi:hypothetical protein
LNKSLIISYYEKLLEFSFSLFEFNRLSFLNNFFQYILEKLIIENIFFFKDQHLFVCLYV